jgi:site-specific recombinase XerD
MHYKTLFFPRKEKTNRDTHRCPLFLRITTGNIRTELSLNKWIDPEKWDSNGQRLVGNSPEARAINDYIKSVEVKLHNIHTSLFNNNEVITAPLLKVHILGQTEQQKTVLEAFDYHLRHNEKGYSVATTKKYGYCRAHLKNFIWKTCHTTDVFLSKVDLPFIKEFQLYLSEKSEFKSEAGTLIRKVANEHNSTLKYVKMFRTIINGAVANRWLDSDPFASFKVKFKTVDQEFLNEDELNQIRNKEILIDRLRLVRDLFVFSCFTGLAYSDLEKLSREHIVFGIDEKKWINIKRTKTNTFCKIPLLPIAEEILAKYESHPICMNSGKLLPVCSNQKLNAYLKEIGDLSGISKRLTCHAARRTFATIASDSGVPAEAIIKIIGHSGFKYLHLYAKTGDRKLASDVEILRSRFK